MGTYDTLSIPWCKYEWLLLLLLVTWCVCTVVLLRGSSGVFSDVFNIKSIRTSSSCSPRVAPLDPQPSWCIFRFAFACTRHKSENTWGVRSSFSNLIKFNLRLGEGVNFEDLPLLSCLCPQEYRKKHKDARRKLKASQKSWGLWEVKCVCD